LRRRAAGRARARALLAAAALAMLVAPATARAQMGGMGPGRAPMGPSQSQPKAAPKGPTPEELEELHNAYQRTSEPEIAPPSSPLTVSQEIRDRIGSDFSGTAPSPEGSLKRTQWLPYYEEVRGDYRLRLLPPFYLEQTRGLTDPSQARYGVPRTEDKQGVAMMLYYYRRSHDLDVDVLFPGLWRVRDRENHVVVAGPFAHREAPGENDNWLAPLFFQGSRPGGGYFHSLPLLTTSHWGADGAFTLVGPYFRDRTKSDVDMGVAPFFFHGDNGSTDGTRRTYTLVPPLLFYHSAHELDSATTTVVGPVIVQSDAKRDVFDIAPFFFHSDGNPETGGVPEFHTTLLPFFHYGRDPDKSLFILPGYYRRVGKDSDTLLSLVYDHATTHNGAASMTAVGPIIPVVWNYRDTELGVHAWAVAPLFYTSSSPAGHDWLTPVVGHFETYAQSSTTWLFPTLTINKNTHGWEDDVHPILYLGRKDDSSHTVVAPVFWDFANPTGRTTIGFPVFWRFADGADDAVTQVAANTLYMQKRVGGGTDWQFHFLPLFSYGEDPRGHFWNVLFGLAGYSRHGTETETRVLWIPFSGGTPNVKTATAR
jgi:hypothetical protein